MKKFASVTGLLEYCNQEGATRLTILPIFEGIDMTFRDTKPLAPVTKILEPGVNGRITMTNRIYGRLNKLPLFNHCKTMMAAINEVINLINTRPKLAINIKKQIGELLIWAPDGMCRLEVDLETSNFGKMVEKFNELGYVVCGYICVIDPFTVSYKTQTVLKSKLKSEETMITRITKIEWVSVNATVMANIHFRGMEDSKPMMTKSVGYMENNHLHQNDYATCQIDELGNIQLRNIRRSKTSENVIPLYCPCCNSALSRSDHHLICTEPSCLDTNTDKLLHWCNVLKLKIEKDAIVKMLLNGINNIVDILNLSKEELIKKFGLSDEKAEAIMLQIDKLKVERVPDGTLLFGVFPFGISHKDCRSLNSINFEEIQSNPLVREGYIYIPIRTKEILTTEYSVLTLLKKMIGERNDY